MRSNSNAANILCFAAGISLGTAVGILFAPGRGSDTRKYFADRTSAARGYLDYGRDLYEKGRELADEAEQMYEDGRHLIER
jgi:gas vesicle protein